MYSIQTLNLHVHAYVRTRVRATAVNTFRKQRQTVWRPPTLAQTHQGHNHTELHNTVHRQAQKVAAAASPRRPRSPLRDRRARAIARRFCPTSRTEKQKLNHVAQLAEKAIIDPILMVVLQGEADNDHKDGRVEACGTREAVLA